MVSPSPRNQSAVVLPFSVPAWFGVGAGVVGLREGRNVGCGAGVGAELFVGAEVVGAEVVGAEVGSTVGAFVGADVGEFVP